MFNVTQVFRDVSPRFIDLVASSLVLRQNFVVEESGQRITSPIMLKMSGSSRDKAGVKSNRHCSKATFLRTWIVKPNLLDVYVT